MEAEEFTRTEEVQTLIRDLKKDRAEKKIPDVVSDIVDDEGLQYVDLVMEGGGVLGVALVGYTYVLEEMGIRFLRVGGTSAGSINAALIAGLGPPAERKSGKIIEQLANVDFWEFVDGDEDARDFVRTLVRNPGWFRVGLKGLQVLDSMLSSQLALNPGDAFYEWISKLLKDEGVGTTEALLQRMATLPKGLKIRDVGPIDADRADPYLALVAADISTQTKVEFPSMAPLYWGKDSASVDPALYVRASMSIPFFFEPLKVKVPHDAAASELWDRLAGYTGVLPETATFVDGGIMSNFPIDLFHEPQVPSAPTFGAKLGTDQRSSGTIGTLSGLAKAVFRSATHTLDYDFIKRNPDYKRLVSYIDTGEHSWLGFHMSERDKVDLFTRGACRAAEFLRRFRWAEYKEVRGLGEGTDL